LKKKSEMMRRPLGIVFLLLQLAAIAHARFVPSRWLAWAPNDYAVWYQLDVGVNGHFLSPQEIEQRYQLPAEHVYQNPPQNIIEMIEQYERTYGRNDHAEVVLRYCVNGRSSVEWRWPSK
jgi:hypothetical protein